MTFDFFSNVPQTCTDYMDHLSEYSSLVRDANSQRLEVKALRYTKTNLKYVWYILAALKLLLGKKTFNNTVGIRHWDIGLCMVDTVALSDDQFNLLIVILKALLLREGIDPNNDKEEMRFNAQIVNEIMYDAWNLRQKNWDKGSAAGPSSWPKWEDIKTLPDWLFKLAVGSSEHR